MKNNKDNNHSNLISYILFFCLCLFLMSCSETYNKQSTLQLDSLQAEKTTDENKSQAIIFPVESPEILLKLQGSNTIGEKLAPALASEYLLNLGADSVTEVNLNKENERSIQAYLPVLKKVVSIDIKAHGSSTSFQGFEKNEINIGMSSRPIKESERLALMALHGDLSAPENENVLGLDGLAIITHPNNPVTKLTIKQLAQIFSGEINNWKQVGGKDSNILVFARDDKSGTFDSFKSMVLKLNNSKLVATAERFESNSRLSQKVNLNQNAIGFTGMAYVGDNNVIDIAHSQESKYINPSKFMVNTEDYPLVRRLYLYSSAKQNRNPHIKKFINFTNSKQGQQIVESQNFVSQSIYTSDTIVVTELPIKYQRVVFNYSRLSLNFRLKLENSELDTKSYEDIDRLANYIKDNNISNVRVIGFTDNVGDEEYNLLRSKRRAYIITMGLRKRGIRNVEPIGLGATMPLATDDNVLGRYKNNRVEIWVQDKKESPIKLLSSV